MSNSYSQHINIRSRALRLFTTSSVVLLCMRKETIRCLWLRRWRVVVGVKPHCCTSCQHTLVPAVMKANSVAVTTSGHWAHCVWMTTWNSKNDVYLLIRNITNQRCMFEKKAGKTELKARWDAADFWLNLNYNQTL